MTETAHTTQLTPSLPSARRTPAWVEVDLAAVRHNVRAVRGLSAGAGGEGPSLIAVVKANAYGHGAVPVARAAAEGGAAALAVASLAEGEELRQAGICAPVLVLSAGDPETAEDLVRLGLTQTLCTEEMAEALSLAAARLGQPARVHLKIDTGMGRLGVRPEHVGAFAARLASLPGLEVDGVFSHLATAEEADPGYVGVQAAAFTEALAALAAAGLRPRLRHLAASAAALRYPALWYDAVRTGLLVYGLFPDAPELPAVDLRPALAWKTRLAFVRTLPGGQSVSYSRTHTTKGECLCGVLPLGYADGYPRHASNRAHVLVRGTLCPVIGTVCMDHVIVDLSPAGAVAAGEEVVLVGAQGAGRITANHLAAWAQTVVHQVPTVIGKRVARYYLESATEGCGLTSGGEPV